MKNVSLFFSLMKTTDKFNVSLKLFALYDSLIISILVIFPFYECPIFLSVKLVLIAKYMLHVF